MKNPTRNLIVLLLALLMMSACGFFLSSESSPTTPGDISASDLVMAVPFESHGLAEFQGDGYSFFYPIEATVEITTPQAPQTSVVTVQGPIVQQMVGQADLTGPGYTIVIRTYENPDSLDAEAWGRAYLISLWERILAEGGPLSIPVSQEGVINEDDVGTTTVASKPAFWIEWFGGDHARMEYFIANGDQIVSFSFGDYPLANQPLNEVQQGVYSLIMGTLTLDGD
jgi:hypothetical protein